MLCSQSKIYQSKAHFGGNLKKQSEIFCYLLKGEIGDQENGLEEGQAVFSEG